jgi:hypothetical protein
MKTFRFILLVGLLAHFSLLAQQDTILVKPLLAFKFAPLGVLAPDPNFQFQAEYFTRKNSSVEIGFGIGSGKTFKESRKEATTIYRIEYKRYLRPFTTARRAAGYLATELSHKDILINEVVFKKGTDNFIDTKDRVDYQLDANFTAIRVKYGYTFFGEQGVPVFNAFAGIGVGYRNHRNTNLPPGYVQDDFGMNLLRRAEGSGVALSLHGGLGFGFGFTRKP